RAGALLSVSRHLARPRRHAFRPLLGGTSGNCACRVRAGAAIPFKLITVAVPNECFLSIPGVSQGGAETRFRYRLLVQHLGQRNSFPALTGSVETSAATGNEAGLGDGCRPAAGHRHDSRRRTNNTPLPHEPSLRKCRY